MREAVNVFLGSNKCIWQMINDELQKISFDGIVCDTDAGLSQNRIVWCLTAPTELSDVH